jgi:hypothetical protein
MSAGTPVGDGEWEWMRHRSRRVAAVATIAAAASSLLAFVPAHATDAVAVPTPHVMRQASSVQPPPISIGIETPAAGVPAPGNMAYFGGPVLTSPKVYLVFWGWGGAGKDPNHVDTILTNFFKGVGGSAWEGVVTQYYETVGGKNINIKNPTGQLAGVWYDTAAIHDNLSAADYAASASRAVAHFNAGKPNPNANYFVATPKKYNDAGFNAGDYCAYHDYTTKATYPKATAGIAFTVMPYIPNAGAGCGQGFVNTPGTNDGVTIVGGHEFLEAVTDPRVEDGSNGGWFDTIGNENADKCAWVEVGPGIPTNVKFSTGTYPVQGTWSNNALDGTGACATS